MAIPVLTKDFLEFLQSLNAHKVRYLIVGGFAVGFHGYPRPTVDMDIFVEMKTANANRLHKAIGVFGFSSDEYRKDFFTTPDSILMIGREPWRIDLFTNIKGLSFAQAYPKRVIFEVGGIKIPFVGKEDLIKSKLASGRNRDIDDVTRLTTKSLSSKGSKR